MSGVEIVIILMVSNFNAKVIASFIHAQIFEESIELCFIIENDSIIYKNIRE